MEKQSEWIEVERNEFEEATDSRSMVVRISVSPYDVPHHIRGALDEDKRRFVIEFKYVDREPTKAVKAGRHAIAEIGKHSGRIYSLDLDLNALRADKTGLEIKSKADDAMRDLADNFPQERAHRKNYALAQNVIDAYWNSLSNFLAGMAISPARAFAR